MEVIHQDGCWRIERQPEGTTNPYLVRFIKHGRNGKLLDQTAEWVLRREWYARRWVPRHPQVPSTLIAKVEAHMRTVQP